MVCSIVGDAFDMPVTLHVWVQFWTKVHQVEASQGAHKPWLRLRVYSLLCFHCLCGVHGCTVFTGAWCSYRPCTGTWCSQVDNVYSTMFMVHSLNRCTVFSPQDPLHENYWCAVRAGNLQQCCLSSALASSTMRAPLCNISWGFLGWTAQTRSHRAMKLAAAKMHCAHMCTQWWSHLLCVHYNVLKLVSVAKAKRHMRPHIPPARLRTCTCSAPQ